MATINERMQKYYSGNDRSVTINACTGHFATPQAHLNYLVDVTRLKIRINEAHEAAMALKYQLLNQVTSVDSVVCLDNMDVVGSFLAYELDRGDFTNNNQHETVYVVHPEENTLHQFMYRESNRIAIQGKSVLMLMDTITTGTTIQRAIECTQYYGGNIVGVCTIFSDIDSIMGHKIYTVFRPQDLPGFESHDPQNCPLCAKKIPVEAMISGYGYVTL